jgi:hypothetical protein
MRARWSAGFVLLLAAGCGGERVAPVSGRVTLDGRPLANALVTFQPLARGKDVNPGPGSAGKTDADGRYTLQVVGRTAKGAMVGPHRVAIIAYARDLPRSTNDSNPNLPPPIVPARYHAETELLFDVPPGGTAAADFDLTGEPSPKRK